MDGKLDKARLGSCPKVCTKCLRRRGRDGCHPPKPLELRTPRCRGPWRVAQPSCGRQRVEGAQNRVRTAGGHLRLGIWAECTGEGAGLGSQKWTRDCGGGWSHFPSSLLLLTYKPGADFAISVFSGSSSIIQDQKVIRKPSIRKVGSVLPFMTPTPQINWSCNYN